MSAVPANRILDYSSDEYESNKNKDKSDEDEPGEDESNSDDSFKLPISEGEDSDSSFEKVVLPKPTPRRKNGLIYLDLTFHEVIEDEDHQNPDATNEDLERVSKKFLESLTTETYVQTPAATKKSVVPVTSKRRLFTPNYENQTPFDEIKTPVNSPINYNDKVVKLKTPIPTYLIPPQYRERPLTTIDGIKESSTPTMVISSVNKKKQQIPTTYVSGRICGFLESLNGN